MKKQRNSDNSDDEMIQDEAEKSLILYEKPDADESAGSSSYSESE